MRTKVTLVLLFLNGLLFLFIFRFERAWRTELAAEEVRHRVLGAEATDLIGIAVQAPDRHFRLERRGEGWRLTEPVEWPANPAAVDRIRTDLQLLDDETSFSVRDMTASGQSLADYGLDRPAMTVTLTSSGSASGAARLTTLQVGNVTKVGQRLYLLSSDGARIHVVGRSIVDSLSLPIARLRSDAVFTIPVYEARSLNLVVPGQPRVRIQRDGDRWLFETPVPARADKTAVELAINALNHLRLVDFTSARASPAGSGTEAARITLEGNNRTETLRIENPLPGEAAGGGVRAATLEDAGADLGRSVRFTTAVPEPLWGTIAAAAKTLRDRRVLELDPLSVTGLQLQAPGSPDLVLRRLEPGAGPAGWQLVLPVENGKAPRSLAADAGAVSRVLDELARLSANAFASDAPTDAQREKWGLAQPERRLVLTTGRTIQTLEIGRGSPADPVAYAQAGGSLSVVTLPAEVLRDLPVAPGDWRDRQLMQLPSAARLASLHLTDLTTGRAVWEWDSGGAASPARRTAALAVGSLWRQLRAARFAGGGFGPAGSPEGAWRYRLDGIFLLPGGGGGEARSAHSLFLGDRTAGTVQWAGAAEFDSVFLLEQPMIDTLFVLTFGDRDPGPP